MSGVDIAGLVERLRDERHCNDWYLRQEAADALDEALAALKASEERGAAAAEVLEECEEYFDNRADADCEQDGFIPNKEMRLLSVVRTALQALENGSAVLADATNNPPSDPGTEQREAGA